MGAPHNSQAGLSWVPLTAQTKTPGFVFLAFLLFHPRTAVSRVRGSTFSMLMKGITLVSCLIRRESESIHAVPIVQHRQ